VEPPEFFENGLTMISTDAIMRAAGETEAGSAGRQPARDSRPDLDRRSMRESRCSRAAGFPARLEAAGERPPCLRESTL